MGALGDCLKGESYRDFSKGLSDLDLVDKYIEVHDKTNKYSKSLRWIEELRDRNRKFSDSYKDFNELCMKITLEHNKFVYFMEVLDDEITSRVSKGLIPTVFGVLALSLDYSGPFKKLEDLGLA